MRDHCFHAVRLRRIVLTLYVALIFCMPAIAQGRFKIIKKLPIRGEGSWDYLTVDGAARRLYVSHDTQVEVIDVDSGVIVGKIANTAGVHGIAIALELGRGFVSNSRSSTVTVFELKTLNRISEVPTGQKPDAIIYDRYVQNLRV